MDTLTTPHEQAVKFCEAMAAKFPTTTFEVDPKGRKYIRIVQVGRGGGASVHAFVDAATGDLLKDAGWAGPAKGARGNIMDDADLEAIVARADQFGGYLYAR